MPSLSVTPAAFVLSFGDVTTQPARETIGALVLAFTGGQANAGPSSTFNSVNVPKLDSQKRQIPIADVTNGKAYVTVQEQLRQQSFKEAIERAFAGQQGQITDLSVIVARLEAAEAQASAAQAQSAATASSDALAKSYVEGLSISATSAGAITISAHTRVYGDGTSVSVNGGSLTGWSQGQYVQVYYDDAGKAGGAVAYQGTTAVIAQQGARHIVAGIAIPVAGSPPAEGTPPLPPGYIPPRDYFEETI